MQLPYELLSFICWGCNTLQHTPEFTPQHIWPLLPISNPYQPSQLAFLASSALIFQSLKILKLEDVLHLNAMRFLCKAINKLSPSHFHNYFHPNATVHKIGTQHLTRGDLFKSLRNTSMYGQGCLGKHWLQRGKIRTAYSRNLHKRTCV